MVVGGGIVGRMRPARIRTHAEFKKGLRRTHRPEVYLEPKWLRYQLHAPGWSDGQYGLHRMPGALRHAAALSPYLGPWGLGAHVLTDPSL